MGGVMGHDRLGLRTAAVALCGGGAPPLLCVAHQTLCGGVPGGFLPLPYRHCLFLCTLQQNIIRYGHLLECIRHY